MEGRGGRGEGGKEEREKWRRKREDERGKRKVEGRESKRYHLFSGTSTNFTNDSVPSQYYVQTIYVHTIQKSDPLNKKRMTNK